MHFTFSKGKKNADIHSNVHKLETGQIPHKEVGHDMTQQW